MNNPVKLDTYVSFKNPFWGKFMAIFRVILQVYWIGAPKTYILELKVVKKESTEAAILLANVFRSSSC